MGTVIAFILGLVIGSMFGFLCLALIVASRDEDRRDG